MNRIQTKGFVLQRRDYGEADRILLILAEQEFLSVFAKGVRRLKSKLASGIEVFTLTDFTLIQSTSELKTLRSAKPITTYTGITGDYDKLQSGYELLKVLVSIKQSADPRIFKVTKVTLEYLDNKNSLMEIAELWFLLKIMQILGQDPNLNEDHNGVVLAEDLRYFLHPDSGSLVPSESDAAVFDANAIKMWRLAKAQTPQYLEAINGTHEIAKRTLPSLREFVQYHLG